MGIIRRPNRRQILKTTMALAATGALPARAGALPHEPSRAGAFPHIDASLRAAVGAQEVPGVVAIAATENGILYEGVFGSRRLSGGPAKDAAMTRDTVFRIASMVKLITSVAALRLVEEGKLSLDGPLPEIDPAVADPQVLDGFDPKGAPLLRPPKRPIALRHLLTHTSGFTYRLWDAEAIKYGNAVEKVPAPERFKLPRTPLMFDPGERWQYGTSIDWVGRIVESISGEPLETHFKKQIFEPLGMKDTTFEITAPQRTREASGHHRQPDGSLKPEPMEPAPKPQAAPRHHSGGGGIYSTAPDYLTLLRMLMHGGSFEGARILRPETVALMGQNQIGRGRSRHPENHGAAGFQRRRFLSRYQLEMGLRPHDQHAAGAGSAQRRQHDLGRPVQHLLLDRSEEARRRGVHDPSAAVCRRARVARLSPIRARRLCGGEDGVIVQARIPGAAQHESVALQNRDRLKLRACNDPGSASHRYRAAPRPGNQAVQWESHQAPSPPAVGFAWLNPSYKLR